MSRLARDTLEHRRMIALSLLRRGIAQAEVARAIGVSRQAVSKWWRAFETEGTHGLRRRPTPGRPPRVSREALIRVLSITFRRANRDGIERDAWSAPIVARLIQDCFGVRYRPEHVWWRLRSVGWPISRHPARQGSRAELRGWLARRWPAVRRELKRVARS